MRKKITAKKKSIRRKKGSNEARVFACLREYKKKFRLSDYRFTVKFVRGEKVSDYYAEVLINGKRVRMFINADIMDADPGSIHDTVIHELLHVMFYRLMEKTSNIVESHVRRQVVRAKFEKCLESLEHEIIEKLVPIFVKTRGCPHRTSERIHNGNSR